jgi:integrase
MVRLWPAGLRARLAAEGAPGLHAELDQCDPESAAKIRVQDGVRIVRALEVFEATGRTLSDWHRAGMPSLLEEAGAFRRSELVGIDVRAVEWTASGLIISLHKSKTDQEWRGREVGVPHAQGCLCPVAALRSWLEASGITEGPVFRALAKSGRIGTARLSSDAIAAIVKRRVADIGLNPALYSGHSLRAGFATSAAAAGLPTWKIKAQTGHTLDAVLYRYIRVA